MSRKTYQDAVLDRLTEIATKHALKVVEAREHANTGTLVAQVHRNTYWTSVCRASYQFNTGHNKVCFNGGALGTADGFLFAEHDDEKVNAMFARWNKLCDARPGR